MNSYLNVNESLSEICNDQSLYATDDDPEASIQIQSYPIHKQIVPKIDGDEHKKEHLEKSRKVHFNSPLSVVQIYELEESFTDLDDTIPIDDEDNSPTMFPEQVVPNEYICPNPEMEIDSTPEFSSISTINFSMESYDNFEQGIRERSCEGIVLSDSFMAKIEMTDDLCEDVFHYIYYRSVSSAMYKLRKESSTSTSQKTVKDEKRHDDLFNPAKVPSFLSLFQNKIACKDRSFSSCDEKYMAKDKCRNECNMLKIDKSSYSLSEKGVDLCKPSKILRKDALCDSTKQVVGQVSKSTDMFLEADMNEPLFCSSPSTIQQVTPKNVMPMDISENWKSFEKRFLESPEVFNQDRERSLQFSPVTEKNMSLDDVELSIFNDAEDEKSKHLRPITKHIPFDYDVESMLSDLMATQTRTSCIANMLEELEATQPKRKDAPRFERSNFRFSESDQSVFQTPDNPLLKVDKNQEGKCHYGQEAAEKTQTVRRKNTSESDQSVLQHPATPIAKNDEKEEERYLSGYTDVSFSKNENKIFNQFACKPANVDISVNENEKGVNDDTTDAKYTANNRLVESADDISPLGNPVFTKGRMRSNSNDSFHRKLSFDFSSNSKTSVEKKTFNEDEVEQIVPNANADEVPFSHDLFYNSYLEVRTPPKLRVGLSKRPKKSLHPYFKKNNSS